MSLNLDEVKYALNNYPTVLTGRVQLLSLDEVPESEITGSLISCSISRRNTNGIRNTITLNLENVDGKYTPRVGKFWVGQKLQLFLGYTFFIDGESVSVEYSQGIYVLKEANATNSPEESTISISMVDKFGLINGELGGILPSTASFAQGEIIKDIITSILTLNKDPKPPILSFGNDTAPYTVYEDNTYGDLMLELNAMLANDMYYDNEGYLRCEQNILDEQKEVVYTFDNESKQEASISIGYNPNKTYNAVRVVGDNVNGDIAIGVAINDNPLSKVSTYYTNGIPQYAPIIYNTTIPTDVYAQALADYELQRYNRIFASINIQLTVPFFFATVDKLIRISNEELGLEGELFVINAVNINVSDAGSSMSINASQISLIVT